jgi:hypothetical protein
MIVSREKEHKYLEVTATLPESELPSITTIFNIIRRTTMSFPVTISRPLSRHLSRLRDLARQSPSDAAPLQGNHNSLPNRLGDVFLRTWDLGFTAFGGPPVHFQILHQRFVEGRGGKQKWVDEATVRYIISLC